MASAQTFDKDEEFWQLVAKYRRESRDGMLQIMAETARNSNDVAKELGISVGSASNYLREAVEEDLVECVTPNAHKHKMYKLTKRGQKVLAEL